MIIGQIRFESQIEVVLYFFSSRRRHTIFDCDWSSDVCSSDLFAPAVAVLAGEVEQLVNGHRLTLALDADPVELAEDESKEGAADFGEELGDLLVAGLPFFDVLHGAGDGVFARVAEAEALGEDLGYGQALGGADVERHLAGAAGGGGAVAAGELGGGDAELAADAALEQAQGVAGELVGELADDDAGAGLLVDPLP